MLVLIVSLGGLSMNLWWFSLVSFGELLAWCIDRYIIIIIMVNSVSKCVG